MDFTKLPVALFSGGRSITRVARGCSERIHNADELLQFIDVDIDPIFTSGFANDLPWVDYVNLGKAARQLPVGL